MRKIVILLLAVFYSQLAVSQFYSDTDFNTDLDPSGFPANGKLYFSGEGKAIANDGQNRILIAGKNGNDILVTRIFANGSLDVTFNDNVNAFNGLGRYDLGGPATVTCMAVDRIHSKIYVAGYSAGPDLAPAPLYHSFVLSLNFDGSLNTNFSTDGIAFLDLGTPPASFDERIYTIGIQNFGINSGKVVVAGVSQNRTTLVERHLLARIEADGTADNDGFNNGTVLAAFAGAGSFLKMDISPTDEIALISSRNNIIKLTNQGDLDPAFNSSGSAGIFNVEPNAALPNILTDVVFYPGGKIVALLNPDKDYKLIRLTSDGQSDVTFNEFGTPGSIQLYTTDADTAIQLQLDPYKNILAIGVTDVPFDNLNYSLVKISPEGTHITSAYLTDCPKGIFPSGVIMSPDSRLMIVSSINLASPLALVTKVHTKYLHNQYFFPEFSKPKYIGSPSFLLPESGDYLNGYQDSAYYVYYSTNKPAKLKITGRLATIRDSGVVAIRAYIPEDTLYYAFDSINYLTIEAVPPAIIIGPTSIPEGKENVYTFTIKPDTLSGTWDLEQYGYNPDRGDDFTMLTFGGPVVKYYLEADFPGGVLKYNFVDPNTDELKEVSINLIPRPLTEGSFEVKDLDCSQELVSCAGNYIDIFRINTLRNDSSGCSMGGYSEFLNSDKTTQLLLNENYKVNIGIRSVNNTANFVGLYIDYDNNGDFAGPDEFVIGGGVNTNEITTLNIRVRNEKNYVGTRRLRIRTRSNSPLSYGDGCQAVGESGETEDYLISIQERDQLQGAHVLTPNNDGKNDFFTIRGIDSDFGNKLVVFNRLGEVKFVRENYTNDWDGKDPDGELLLKGTYFYTFTNGDNSIKGFFELLY